MLCVTVTPPLAVSVTETVSSPRRTESDLSTALYIVDVEGCGLPYFHWSRDSIGVRPIVLTL